MPQFTGNHIVADDADDRTEKQYDLPPGGGGGIITLFGFGLKLSDIGFLALAGQIVQSKISDMILLH